MLWWRLHQLRSKNPEIRARAARKLGASRNVRAVAPLVAVSAAPVSEKPEVREAAAQALIQIGKVVVAPLVAVLRHEPRVSRRQAAAQALGQIGDARAVEPLVAAVRDETGAVLPAAVQALGQIGDARAVAPLAAVLRDSEISVQEAAVEALGQIGDARAVEPLRQALVDPKWGRIYYPGYQALTEHGCIGSPAYEKDIRKSAAEALRKIHAPKAREAIREYQ